MPLAIKPYLLVLLCLLALHKGYSQEQTVYTPSAYVTGIPVNYVRTWSVVKPTTNANDFILTSGLQQARITTQYLDGLGRPLQTVVKQGSWPAGGSAVDMVSASVYDEFGREPRKYLPFAASTYGSNASVSDGLLKFNPFQQQQYFHSDAYANGTAQSPVKGQGETYYYGKTEFEASPLNRVERTYSPGDSWVAIGKGVKMKYWINTAADAVRMWNVTNAVTLGNFGAYATPSINGTYPAGELFKTVTVDEHDKQVIEFKDKEGKVILKKVQLTGTGDNGGGVGTTADWLSTYYIYDDLEQLRCVIQPRGVEELGKPAVNWDLAANNVLLTEQCFRYEYDDRGRMIVKQVPGAKPVYMVYDKRDRLVMTQDGNLGKPGAERWLVTLYDELNRPVGTGLWTNNSSWIAHATAAGSGTYYFYPFTVDNTPSSGWEELTKIFYDNYDWRSSNSGQSFSASMDGSFAAQYLAASTSTYPYPETPAQSSGSVKGMVTGAKIKVLGSSPEQYLYTITYYDGKARAVQVQSQNITGGVDIATTQYSFAGQVLISIVRHQKGGVTKNYTVITKNTYDDLGRLAKIEKKLITPAPPSGGIITIGGGDDEAIETAFQSIAQYTYDALGQLKTKKLAPDFNGGLEMLTYDYNIRGWMLGANRDYAKNTASGSNWFGFDLGYDKAAITTGSTMLGTYGQAAYNGNIAGTVWKSRGDGEIRKYAFGYDNVNRLLGAVFTQYGSAGFGQDPQLDFTVSNLSYDGNGNIKSMDQMGWRLGGSTVIDQLRYTYQENGLSNKLLNVMDISNKADTRLGDFRYTSLHPQAATKDAYISSPQTANTGTVTDYSYDDNGNLTKDFNKDIEGAGGASGIEYNYLNLPVKIHIKKAGGGEKGYIEYVYDASGTKLKKFVHEDGKPGKSMEGGQSGTTTLYMYGTYEDYVLQFFPHEEGRIRMVPVQTSGGGPIFTCDPYVEGFDDDGYPIYSICPPHTTVDAETFVYDYFLKDHLGNVRTVLTEEQKMSQYPAATMELPEGSTTNPTEEAIYSNVPDTRTRLLDVPGYPAQELSHENKYAAKLKGGTGGHKIGPGVMLKVMSGDYFHLTVQSWYKLQPNQSPDLSSHPFTQLITALAGGAASITPVHGTSSVIEGSGVLSSPVTDFFTDRDNNHTTSGQVKAYLNWILLDEHFNFVQASSGAEQVPAESAYNNGSSNPNVYQHVFTNLPITKNGYLYVFVSNETPNVDVFFDNLQVTHFHGPLLEETHYYPFGLRMEGICSRAASSLENKYQFNGKERQAKEFSDGSGLEYLDFGARMYDAQIGRWQNIDQKVEKWHEYSPYVYTINNPVLITDIDGRDLIILIGGRNANSDWSRQSLDKRLHAWAEKNGRNDLRIHTIPSNLAARGEWEENLSGAIAMAKRNGEKVILYGYSWGGDTQIEIANKVKEEYSNSSTIDLLVTVDPADGPIQVGDYGGAANPYKIDDNVIEAVNFWQPHEDRFTLSGGARVVRKSSNKKTKITNVQVTDADAKTSGYPNGVNHMNIDVIVENRVFNTITDFLNAALNSNPGSQNNNQQTNESQSNAPKSPASTVLPKPGA